MKDLGITFDSFISILLPGWIGTLLAAAVLHDPNMPCWAGTVWRDWIMVLQEKDLRFSIVLIGVSAFLGVTLASLGGALELAAFDWLQYRRIARANDVKGSYGRKQYDTDWHAYVDSLAIRPQPYLRRLAVFYFFEMRTGLALLLTAIVALAFSAGVEWTVCAGMGAVLLFLSYVSHSQLAAHRYRLGPSTRKLVDSVATVITNAAADAAAKAAAQATAAGS